MLNALGPDTFAGVTVLDLTRLLPGPFATMLLADLGAKVIKVEPPMGGDYARWTPPMVEGADGGYGAFFEALNRGKQSVALDLKKPDGARLFGAMVANADVVVESFRPGVMERLGFGPDALRAIRSDLVFVRLSGFGQDGPLSERAGHDINFLALSGMLGLTGPTDSVPGIPAVQVGDIAGGALYTAFAVAAALYRRERTGLGATVDVSMTEGVLSMLGPVINTFAATGVAPARGGDTLSGGLPCYRVYPTSDGGHLAVGALEPKFWAAVCQAIGRPDWANDGLLLGEAGEQAAVRLREVFASRTTAEWRAVFDALDACTEAVRPLEDVVTDELFRVRGAIRPTPDGRLAVVAPTSRACGPLEELRPPLLGEHTRAAAEAAAWSAEQIDRALESGALAARTRLGG